MIINSNGFQYKIKPSQAIVIQGKLYPSKHDLIIDGINLGNNVIIDGNKALNKYTNEVVFSFDPGKDGIIDRHDVAQAYLKSGEKAPEGFDATYYLTTYPDVAKSLVDPVQHYLHYGKQEARNPNGHFDENFYRQKYPDVDRGIKEQKFACGYDHYISYGAKENRIPKDIEGFDAKYYVANNPDVKSLHMDPLEHYYNIGGHEGRNPNAAFNEVLYRKLNPDVNQAIMDGAIKSGYLHYLEHGRDEGRLSTILPGFDAKYYESTYHDALQSLDIEPIQHYLLYGQKLGASPNPNFNEKLYRELYSDVNDAVNKGVYQSGYHHYLANHQNEPRITQVFKGFDAKHYTHSYPDVKVSGMDPFVHFVKFGGAEHRKPNPIFDTEKYEHDHPEVVQLIQEGKVTSAYEYYLKADKAKHNGAIKAVLESLAAEPIVDTILAQDISDLGQKIDMELHPNQDVAVSTIGEISDILHIS